MVGLGLIISTTGGTAPASPTKTEDIHDVSPKSHNFCFDRVLQSVYVMVPKI